MTTPCRHADDRTGVCFQGGLQAGDRMACSRSSGWKFAHFCAERVARSAVSKFTADEKKIGAVAPANDVLARYESRLTETRNILLGRHG